MEKIRFIELFCGAGGASHGLSLSGMECVFGTDKDRDSIETFKLNHPKASVFQGDVKAIDEKNIHQLFDTKNIDMIFAGPPCQGFSTIGKNKPDDIRRLLPFEVIRIAKILKPKIVIIENVTGLLSENNYHVLELIFKDLQELGYRVDARALSSDEYGTPEIRRRAIIIATSKECTLPQFPQPTHGERGKMPVVTVRKAFEKIKAQDPFHDPLKVQVKNQMEFRRLSKIPEGKGIRYKRDEEKYLPQELWYGKEWDKVREGRFRQTRLQRIYFDKPSPTILTSKTTYYHPKENRYLTIREAACLQGFPTYFKFHGSLTSMFRQIGNAVPVPLAMAIGSVVKIMLRKAEHVEQFDGLSNTKEKTKGAFHYKNRMKV